MNADLEEQLRELGPDYRSVVGRLRAARTVEPSGQGLGLIHVRRGRTTAEWLVAASLLMTLGVSAIFLSPSRSQSVRSSIAPREYRLSPAEMIATQRTDGSWQNDFLTRRNAEILARCEGESARIAYKKAMRNLRSRGIL